MLNKIPNLVINILKNNTNYILTKPYETYFKGKFTINPNYNIATIYYTKYRNYIILNLYGLILKIVFKGFKYLYTLLDTTTK